MKRIAYLIIIALGIGFTACEKFLEAELDNRVSEEELKENPAYFEGLLLHAYNNLPKEYDFGTDVASDDAVTNDKNSDYLRMATGEWQSTFNPVDEWADAFEELFYLNSFIQGAPTVQWSWESEELNKLHLNRVMGEAYGLRALYMFNLLRSVGGKTADGELLGYPIVTKPVTISDDLSLPRNSFKDCVNQILADLDSAAIKLPPKYADIKNEAVLNAALGARWTNRFSGYAAKALKTRVALYAASPAYGTHPYDTAAVCAGKLIAEMGGLDVLSSTGIEFWKKFDDAEIIWATSKVENTTLETDNYPPSLLGNGRTNPTQNLIDVFPMASGLPITNEVSDYDPQNPYVGRDLRLAKLIIYDGATYKDTLTMNTNISDPLDGINNQSNSTRTGYYMRKFVDEKASLAKGNVENGIHFYTYLRVTEVFLNYAEAANRAWGPDADPMGFGFTARDAILAIRLRAGIGIPPLLDTYAKYITRDPDLFAEMVAKERRIELCFEGHRFWDIRRNNKTDEMKSTAIGIYIDPNAEEVYKQVDAESRLYQDFMIYGPVPNYEMLKNDQLIQNSSWD